MKTMKLVVVGKRVFPGAEADPEPAAIFHLLGYSSPRTSASAPTPIYLDWSVTRDLADNADNPSYFYSSVMNTNQEPRTYQLSSAPVLASLLQSSWELSLLNNPGLVGWKGRPEHVILTQDLTLRSDVSMPVADKPQPSSYRLPPAW
jgi:hypothetical protein